MMPSPEIPAPERGPTIVNVFMYLLPISSVQDQSRIRFWEFLLHESLFCLEPNSNIRRMSNMTPSSELFWNFLKDRVDVTLKLCLILRWNHIDLWDCFLLTFTSQILLWLAFRQDLPMLLSHSKILYWQYSLLTPWASFLVVNMDMCDIILLKWADSRLMHDKSWKY